PVARALRRGVPAVRAWRRARALAAAAALAALAALAPSAALACATCLGSAYGDRTYTWAYLGLLVMPFALTAAVGGFLAYRAGWRLPLDPARGWRRRPAAPPEATLKETT
ncbi:MAG TPA: hypothetical protein VFX28_10610, partial [Methylomirabilota bacterium]|nr:hypothetical protein [Methylomirabilota bacterium]